MQKRNKILMIAVSSLLCLTLISSCLVSGVFARYVTKDSAKVSTVFKKWGVTITATPGSSLVQELNFDQADITSFNNGVSFTATGVNIKPGDDFSNAIRFTITGTPEVRCKVIVTFHFEYGKNNYTFIKTGTNKYDMPVGFTFGALDGNNNYVVPNKNGNNVIYLTNLGPWRTYTGTSPSTVGNSITADSMVAMDKTEWIYAYDVENLIDVTCTKNIGSGKDSYFEKIFEPNTEIAFYADAGNTATKIKTLEFGFAWPYEYGTGATEIDNYDELANKVAANIKNDTGTDKNLFKIKYTVSIEQIQ